MLSKDFKEFAESFNAHAVEYLVIGGYALAAFGHPRYTGDLDFWVGTDAANAQRVIKALDAFGFGSLGLSQSDFTKSDQFVQLGRTPNRIDIITTIDGVNFAECFARKSTEIFDGIALNFIAREDFVTNKRASGRLKDLADIESLGVKP